jgi:tetratricopeptide (TPR) repeat protein
VFTFTHAVPVNLPDLSTERFSPLSGPDAQSVQQRLADIEQYLRQAPAEPLATAYLQLEVARLYKNLGQWQDSETAARAAASALQLAGNAQLAAHAQGQIASLLQLQGQLDEALRIRQTEQLPVYERLGDLYYKAVTLGEIADILQLRGQWIEALAIWQTDCLPVFGQLGLVRETAIAQERVAELQALVQARRT